VAKGSARSGAGARLANLHSEFHPLEDNDPARFRASTFCQRVRSADWDAVIIDSHCGYSDAGQERLGQ